MLDLRRIWLIALREWTTRLHQRSFLITTLIQVIVVAAVASLPVVVAIVGGDDDTATDATVVVIDQADADIVDRLTPLLASEPGVDLPFLPVQSIALEPGDQTPDEAREAIDDGDLDGALVVDRADDESLAFTYISPTGDDDSTAQQIYAGIAAINTEDQFEQVGVTTEEFQQATAPPAFEVQSVAETDPTAVPDADDSAQSATLVAISTLFTVLMFMAIVLYGTWVAQGVVEEKSSRIMEIMVNAATPRDLLAGKVIGIGMAGLTQLLPMLLVGGTIFALQNRISGALGGPTDLISGLDFGAVSATAIGWFLVYFLLGFTLYAALYAGLGSLVSRQEEVNQAIAPMMTIVFIGYFAAIFSANTPDTLIARVLSLFPLTSPFVMMSRVINGNVTTWEIATSIGLLAISLIGAMLLAARLYRVGVLMYGQKPSWRAVFSSSTQQAAR